MLKQPGGEDAVYCSGDLNLVGGAAAIATGAWLPELFQQYVAQPLQFGRYYLNLMPDGEAYMGGGASVSYTHLDVYKRQVRHTNLRGEISPCGLSAGSRVKRHLAGPPDRRFELGAYATRQPPARSLAYRCGKRTCGYGLDCRRARRCRRRWVDAGCGEQNPVIGFALRVLSRSCSGGRRRAKDLTKKVAAPLTADFELLYPGRFA